MRPPAYLALALPLALALVACGGTSSESPWPVEPEHREVAPYAEGAAPGAPMEERTPESRGEVGAEAPRRRTDEVDADAGTPKPRKKP